MGGSSSSTWSTPATRSKWRRPTTRRAPTSCASSTSPRRTRIERRPVDLVARTADRLTIPFCVGGGVRSVEDVRACCGGRRQGERELRGGGAPELVATTALRLGLGEPDRGRSMRGVATGRSGARLGGLHARRSALDDSTPSSGSRRVEADGAGEILLTSMDRDGTRDGYDLALTRAVTRAVQIPVIASGGAGTLEHLREALDDGPTGAALPPCSRRASSTSAPTPCPKQRRTSRPRDLCEAGVSGRPWTDHWSDQNSGQCWP